ncbi:MAG: hypothetical protein WCK14_04510 [Actinomycetota bacterium]|jgi:hypothetical protein
MIKRLSWFISGALAGVAGVGYAKKKVKATASHLTPSNVVKSARARLRERRLDVSEALRDGRSAMQSKEAELIARRDGTFETADELGSSDQVLVDGKPVEPGQIIVLRQVRDANDEGHSRNARRTRRGA